MPKNPKSDPLPTRMPSRRGGGGGRLRCGTYACAFAAALLLLLSVSFLYSRISLSPSSSAHPHRRRGQTLAGEEADAAISLADHLVGDDDDDVATGGSLTALRDDRIDELDEVPADEANDDDDDDEDEAGSPEKNRPRDSGYYFDHLSGVIRRRISRRSIADDDWDDDYLGLGFLTGSAGAEDQSKVAIGSDDVPVDETVRMKAIEVAGIEDALMLKEVGGGARVSSSLREGWGDWFDKKSDFLRRDKMFRSSFEVLNPLNNPMIQDPDSAGVTGLTRGDKLVQKLILNEFKKVPFSMKKPLGVGKSGDENGAKLKSEVKRVERRTLDSNVARRKPELDSHVYADGKRWGYYPGLRPDLSFMDFVDEFFRVGKCSLRVFMVWNSPPWMYSVRHQRGLESLLYHHRDACVLLLSETIELDFFKDSFVKDGYKVAVAMPNLDELLKNTPAHVFTSAWFEWRKTKYYATHYSELVRLAVLYKYGGVYLDSDIIVLRPLSSLQNSVGMEDQVKGSRLNGAVMAFRKHSPFLMDCMKEFYMTYDDTRLRWNGADLLSRVSTKFLKTQRNSIRELDLKVHHSSVFFPISSQNITRYFTSPTAETEKTQQDALFEKILNESLTFHFWNSLTSALIPEPDSLVMRLIDRSCIRCSDVL